MYLNAYKVRQLWESHVNDPARAGGGGRTAFVNLFRHWLGLCDKDGNDHIDAVGNRVLKEQKLNPKMVATNELAASILGPQMLSLLQSDASWSRAIQHNGLLEAQNPGDRRALLENVGVGIDVSSFANINAWTSVVGGLIEVKILEAFKNPMFIADELMPAEPTKLNGQKVIGAARLGDQATERLPGQPHKRAGFGERWVQTPATRENALAVDVQKEAVFFDLTGQILEHAGAVGEWLGYRKELDCIDCFIGATSQSTGKCAFNYKGTAQNTYSTTALTGYTNDQSNELVDWSSVETSWLLFQRNTDPETSTRILAAPNTIVVNPAKMATAKLIFSAMESERRTTSATQSTTADLHILRAQGNVVDAFGNFKILFSPLLEQRCTDADGLALNQTNANKYWWMFEKGKPFRYMQNWPLTVLQAPQGQYDMLDRGIVATYFANERGIPSVWSPWHIQRNKN